MNQGGKNCTILTADTASKLRSNTAKYVGILFLDQNQLKKKVKIRKKTLEQSKSLYQNNAASTKSAHLDK